MNSGKTPPENHYFLLLSLKFKENLTKCSQIKHRSKNLPTSWKGSTGTDPCVTETAGVTLLAHFGTTVLAFCTNAGICLETAPVALRSRVVLNASVFDRHPFVTHSLVHTLFQSRLPHTPLLDGCDSSGLRCSEGLHRVTSKGHAASVDIFSVSGPHKEGDLRKHCSSSFTL